jgi:hypothetical protein
MSKPRRAFEVLGPAPAGFNCGLCGRSGPELQVLMSRGYVGLLHRDCAQEFFGAPVVTKPKVAAALDRK